MTETPALLPWGVPFGGNVRPSSGSPHNKGIPVNCTVFVTPFCPTVPITGVYYLFLGAADSALCCSLIYV